MTQTDRNFDWGAAEETAIDILEELRRAVKKHRLMASAHEGYAVLLEEVDELWDEIKAQSQNPVNIRKEAIQVGAMALEIAVAFGEWPS